MIVKSIELKNFRNHAKTQIELSDGLNILVGNNAQGKTNILEAIYLTCVGKGFRLGRDKDMIKFGEQVARVKTIAEKNFGKVSVEVTLSNIPNASGKQIKINAIPIAKMGEMMGSVTCVFFNPDELKMVKESPADRRRFMDIDISQMDKTYFYNLLQYNRILKQRNALLKTIKATPDELRSLDIWDEQLANVGEQITKRRIQFCDQLGEQSKRVHKLFAPNENINMYIEITHNRESASTSEMFHVEQPNNPSLLEVLRSAREKDLRLRTTTVGPHRDDIAIFINDRDVRLYASQGQQRTVALTLKIAELSIFESTTGERPILLLDDVFSELDGTRRERLLELVSGWQTIITATDAPAVPQAKNFIIKDGAVRD